MKLRWHTLGLEEATIEEATVSSQSPPWTAALSRPAPPTTRTLISEKCVPLSLELKGTQGARVMLRWHALGFEEATIEEVTLPSPPTTRTPEKFLIGMKRLIKALRRQKALQEKMTPRMRNAGMYKAWATWYENATELRRQRSLLEKIALRMRSVGLCKVWARWEEQWRQVKKMRRSAEKSRQEVAQQADCAGVSGAQGVSQGA